MTIALTNIFGRTIDLTIAFKTFLEKTIDLTIALTKKYLSRPCLIQSIWFIYVPSYAKLYVSQGNKLVVNFLEAKVINGVCRAQKYYDPLLPLKCRV